LSSAATLLTCEHAGNLVPVECRHLFRKNRKILSTHEAYDAHALSLARHMAQTLDVPLFFARETRLLIDQNRSLSNRNLFSRYSRTLSLQEKNNLIAILYKPHHQRIEEQIDRMLSQQQTVFHFAIHTFTPVFHNKTRTADIGLLYDPGSKLESSACACIRDSLLLSMPRLRVRRNYPYRGTNNGLTAAFRERFGTRLYAGIEIEVNQRMAAAGRLKRVAKDLVSAFRLAART
jgi:predicted N-formylglutamate amidohydrolase